MECTPRLNQEAAVTLQDLYVEDRSKARQAKQSNRSHIPVTVRQLEAIIRLSESIAKMRLSKEVNRSDVEEAHRLFSVSTMNAIKSGLSNHSSENIETVMRAEEAIKRLFNLNDKKVKASLIDELISNSTYKAMDIEMAINNLIRRDEFVETGQESKYLQRKK